jgi:hypothetical protein
MNDLLDESLDIKLRDNAAYMFHHYSTYIAMNMMPFEDQRNPWKSFYPLMARCGKSRMHKSLLHAMLAQAAGNLAYMGCREEDMLTLTLEHYVMSVEYLRKGLEEDSKDFSLVLASVLTLIMAEVSQFVLFLLIVMTQMVTSQVYNGKSKAWRVHLSGAWTLFKLHQVDRPWQNLDIAWLTAQSLCLLKIRCDTMQAGTKTESRRSSFDFPKELISLVASRPEFGFTVGASPELMSYIMDTTQLAFHILYDDPESQGEAVRVLQQRLRSCSLPNDFSNEGCVQLHHRIFQLGAIIYFNRSVLKSPSQQSVAFIDELLQHVKQYRKLGGGYITLWPVFMAAVEAYQTYHQAAFREWLDDNDKMGAASRRDIREVIEAIWRERSHLGEENGVGQGDVIVDWREVAWERGLDILLV